MLEQFSAVALDRPVSVAAAVIAGRTTPEEVLRVTRA
jgi:hypothetical protein